MKKTWTTVAAARKTVAADDDSNDVESEIKKVGGLGNYYFSHG